MRREAPREIKYINHVRSKLYDYREAIYKWVKSSKAALETP